MSKTNIELLPCPFCGGEAKIDYSIAMDPPCHYKTIRVVCLSCGASSVQKITDGYYDEYCDDETISKLWNNRVSPLRFVKIPKPEMTSESAILAYACECQVDNMLRDMYKEIII